MIAITQGIGPAIRPSGSRPRSAAPNLRTPPLMRRPARRVAQRAGRIGDLAAVEPQHLGARIGRADGDRGWRRHRGAELVQRVEQMEQPLAPSPDRRCRSARRRPASRAGRSPRGRWRPAAARRPTGSPGGRWRGRRGRPRRASRAPASRDRLSSTPATRSGSATLSNADRCGTSRKSWKTTPIRRRKPGRRSRGMVTMSSPNSRISPRLGRCAR